MYSYAAFTLAESQLPRGRDVKYRRRVGLLGLHFRPRTSASTAEFASVFVVKSQCSQPIAYADQVLAKGFYRHCTVEAGGAVGPGPNPPTRLLFSLSARKPRNLFTALLGAPPRWTSDSASLVPTPPWLSLVATSEESNADLHYFPNFVLKISL